MEGAEGVAEGSAGEVAVKAAVKAAGVFVATVEEGACVFREAPQHHIAESLEEACGPVKAFHSVKSHRSDCALLVSSAS